MGCVGFLLFATLMLFVRFSPPVVSELLSYLKERGLTYRVDSSNDKPIYLRNRIRREVVPLLKQYNPNLSHTIARQAGIVRDEDSYLDQLAREALAQIQKLKDPPIV